MAGSRRTWPRNIPWVYADDHLREVQSWANGDLGSYMRAWWPVAFPGTPWEAALGFASNGSPNELVRVASMSEFGWAGLTGGPSSEEPPTQLRTAENQYLELHNWPFVRFCLGQAACMVPGCWRPANGGLPDQTAVGIASLIDHGDGVREAMPRAVAPAVRSPWAGGVQAPPPPYVPMSPWSVAAAFWGWSSGDGRAARQMGEPWLAGMPEAERFWRLGSHLADRAYAGEVAAAADSHDSIFHAWIRCAQKLWMAAVIAQWSKDNPWNVVAGPSGPARIGGEPTWFLQGAPSDPAELAWVVSCVAAAASARTPASVGIGARPGGASFSVPGGLIAALAAAAVVGVAAVAVQSRAR